MILQPFTQENIDYANVKLAGYTSGNVTLTAQPLIEEVHFNANSIDANETKIWTIPCHIKPTVMWIREASNNNNKSITWTIKNAIGTSLWIVTIPVSSMTALGNTSYYLFPPMTLEAGWQASVQPSVALIGFQVISNRNVVILAEEFPLN